MPTPSTSQLRRRLDEVMLADQRRLGRRLDDLRKRRDPKARDAQTARIADEIELSALRVDVRRESKPPISYPEQLPISQRRTEIADAIRDHQVVVIAGETGSGKTTQIPKICLELGRGVRGMIGHTQPRRLAARTVAERIADETGTELGGSIGYAVRFTDKVGEQTLLKVMTDGILLAEIQRDRFLRQYDTLIIDEAHERSLNIDFILGFLKQLLPRRPELKVIITSATIDPERFAEHFDSAPIIEVSGRTYPVEIRYRPVVDPEDPASTDRDQTQAVIEAVDELAGEAPGDVLVFLSGEREIRDTADALNAQNYRDTEVLPLYARLSAAEQHRIFQSHRGRRIVLATNVAETSLTVPGIKYVIDPGTARISRYSHRTKVQRLPIEAVSQASANQRSGRCGRTSDGICIRLYTEDDYLSRPEFTEPEILRTNLASVILQMTSLGLGDVAAFPFLDEPDRRSIADGVQLLGELGAINEAEPDPRRRLTPIGRKLAALPLDPRLARMIVEADANGCVREVMIIAAALSIQDPRERPLEHEQAATAKHARFRDPGSDFAGYLSLWNYLREQQKALSSNQFRRQCRTDFVNYLRVREWQDIYAQLRQVAASIGISASSSPGGGDPIHISLLAGLLSHIGMKDPAKPQEFIGARGTRFAVFPGSGLFKKPPAWVMAAELVDTTRLWGRNVARIEPEWAEKLAGDLAKRSYNEPHWERKQAAVIAYEKVTLYGVPIVAARKVNYGRIDAVVARELFIRHALVDGDWDTRHAFFDQNRSLIEEVEDLEDRTRRRDLLVDPETLYEFYDARIPAEVVSGRHFDGWWKKARRHDPALLDFQRSLLIREGAGDVRREDFPDRWEDSGVPLPLHYVFEPGAPAALDGVTVDIPLLALNQARAEDFQWLVPGRREELIAALIKSLPKPIRRVLTPAPDRAKAVLTRVRPGAEPLLDALERELHATTGVVIDRSDWDWSRVPAHLQMNFRIVGDNDRTIAEGKDLDALKTRLAPTTQKVVSQAAASLERTGLTGWTFGTLPRTFEQRRGTLVVTGFPALVDRGASVDIQVLASPARQEESMWLGVRRLLLLSMPATASQVQRALDAQARMNLTQTPHRDFGDLIDDCTIASVDTLMREYGAPVWNEADFTRLQGEVRGRLIAVVAQTVQQVSAVLAVRRQIDLKLTSVSAPAYRPAVQDIHAQLTWLVHRGFVTDHRTTRLADLKRYLEAVADRIDRLSTNVPKDAQSTRIITELIEDFEHLLASYPADEPIPEAAYAVRWMIEELRLSLFAPGRRTAYPVSEKRIIKAMDAL